MRVDIDRIISVFGEDISISQNTSHLRIKRFNRISFFGENNTIKFEVSSEHVHYAPEIIIDREFIDPKTTKDSLDRTYVLTIKAKFEVELHVPNPLSPFGNGFGLKLTIKKNKNKFSLSGNIHYRKGEDWTFKELIPNKTIDAFLSNYKDKEYKFQITIDSISIINCPLFAQENNKLFEIDGYLYKSTTFFYVRFSEIEDSQWILVSGFAARALSNGSPYVNQALLFLENKIMPKMKYWSLTAPLFVRNDIELECATIIFDEPKEPAQWSLDWNKIPTLESRLGDRSFCFNAIWHVWNRHYPLGLHTLSAKNHLSFFPSEILPDDPNIPNPDWTLRFDVEKNDSEQRQDTFKTTLVGLRLKKLVHLRLEFSSALDSEGQVLAIDVKASQNKEESIVRSKSEQLAKEADKSIAPVTASEHFPIISLKLEPANKSPRKSFKLLIGGVLFDIIDLLNTKNISNKYSLIEIDLIGASKNAEDVLTSGSHLGSAKRLELGQYPLKTNLRLLFYCSLPRPGHEDPEFGFSTDAPWLGRERPIVVNPDLGFKQSDQTTPQATLEIDESASDEQSRELEIKVRTIDQQSVRTDVVLLDPCPLMIARVESEIKTTAKKEDLFATYLDRPDSPPGWEFMTEKGEMSLILPPQAIGEEMIKAKLTVKRSVKGQEPYKSVPLVDELFDFRLSPPAQLTLDRTDIETARAPTPWSLRRLLNRREATVGLKLIKAEFELLYGMTTIIEKVESLRVAEYESFIGRVPFAGELEGKYKDGDPYAKAFASWIRSLLYRPVQLPVFENWANRDRLKIDRGISFYPRKSRQTADPFNLENYHPDWDGIPEENPDHRLPLRGGFDYGFESENIYKAVLNNPVDEPNRPQGSISGLVFGSLGGSGSQQALFDEGRTIIISDTTQGRLNTLTIVRVGRIARLWNHARHVIVYERTTRCPPRYEGIQPSNFEGLLALRKVREYLEITQPSRSYPDISEFSLKSGPLVGSFFESTVIPVKSSWGHDVKGGWVMPLWGPIARKQDRSMDKNEEAHYPRPNIYLEFARAPKKGAGKINQLIENPEQLLFFTTTVEGYGSDPELWPLWPDIDFPLTAQAQPPKLQFFPFFEGSSKQPDAQAYDYGHGRFTINLRPAEEAVNMMHGRPNDGLEARIRNVTLVRGQISPAGIYSDLEGKIGISFADLEAQIGDSLSELSAHMGRLSQELGDVPIARVKSARETSGKLIEDVKIKVGSLVAKLKPVNTEIKNNRDSWKKLQEVLAKNSGESWKHHLSKGWNSQLNGIVETVANRLALDPQNKELKDEARSTIQVAFDVAERQSLERLERFAFLPKKVEEILNSTIDQCIAEIDAFFKTTESGWHTHIDNLQSRFDAEGPVALEKQFFTVILDSKSLFEQYVTSATRVVKDRLGPLFADIPVESEENKGPILRIVKAMEEIRNLFCGWINGNLEIIPPFGLGEPDWEFLKESLTPTVLIEQFGDIFEFKDVVIDIIEPLKRLLDGYENLLKAQQFNFKEIYKGELAKIKSHIDKDGAANIDELLSASKKVASNLKESLESINNYQKSIVVQCDRVIEGLQHTDWLKNIASPPSPAESMEKLLADIEKLEDVLFQNDINIDTVFCNAQSVAQKATATLRNIGEQIEQAVSKEVIQAIENKRLSIEKDTLGLIRSLAQGPVTDTLKCTRDWVGYYYDAAKESLDVTRSGALFNDVGKSALNAVSARVPFDRVRDRILPQLKDFDLNKLFPDFAGLKLENLLEGIEIPEDPLAEYEWIKLKHGFDKDRLCAWSEVTIDKRFDSQPELFSLPPLSLQLSNPRFYARTKASNDVEATQHTEGQISAEWIVNLNGQPVMTIESAKLQFDSNGGFDFDFDINKLRFAPALQFITDALKSLVDLGGGVTVQPMPPGGIKAELNLPINDVGTGAFTFTGITIYSHFDLQIANGFEIGVGLWLSKPDRPFGIAISFLGGGGWFGIDVMYRPPMIFETMVSIGLSAGAFIAVNFGVAQGTAGVLFVVGLNFYNLWNGEKGSSSDMAVSIGLLAWGEFNISGIASAYLRLSMRIEYRNGIMTGYGRIKVSIKICWCFTLEVNKTMKMEFTKGQKLSDKVARDLPTVREAIEAYFANLDW